MEQNPVNNWQYDFYDKENGSHHRRSAARRHCRVRHLRKAHQSGGEHQAADRRAPQNGVYTRPARGAGDYPRLPETGLGI